jgi:hypothetical protein
MSGRAVRVVFVMVLMTRRGPGSEPSFRKIADATLCLASYLFDIFIGAVIRYRNVVASHLLVAS